jgi:lysophospholipase L1-like esterase
MMTNLKFVKICVVVSAWMGVLLASTHRSELPAVFGRYSLSYALLLGTFVGIAAVLSLAKSTWLLKVYQARSLIVLNAAFFLVMICLIEAGIRAVDLYGISYYEWVSDYMRNMQADEQLIYRHKPSWETRFGDVLVTYNERGLRDRPILPRAHGEFRILALGDSLTFGWGVPQDQIFAFRLEQILQGRLQQPVRVINTGVGGYNTVQELTYFKREGIAFEPDLVMLTYVENDIEENKGPFNSKPDFTLHGLSLPGMVVEISQKLWLYRLIDHTYHYALYNRLKEQGANSSPGGQGWSDSMSALDELVAICKSRRIPLIFFYFRLEPDAGNPLFQDVLQHAHGVPVKDMGQWFQGRDKFSLTISKVDAHPNAEAHRVMAEHMAVEMLSSLVAQK